MSSRLFLMATGSESWSSKRLSKVLSELGDFLMVIPILAFLTPSGGLDFLNWENQISHILHFDYCLLLGISCRDLLVLGLLFVPGTCTGGLTALAFLSRSDESLPKRISGFLVELFRINHWPNIYFRTHWEFLWALHGIVIIFWFAIYLNL